MPNNQITKKITGQYLLTVIQKQFPGKKHFYFLPSTPPPSVIKATAFLQRHLEVDFWMDDGATFGLISEIMTVLPRLAVNCDENVLQCNHELQYVSPLEHPAYTTCIDLLNRICENTFSQSSTCFNDEKANNENNEDISPEVKALIYLEHHALFTQEMLGHCRRMQNPREGSIALRILNENHISIDSKVWQVLYSTRQPAHVARILYYLKNIRELNDENIDKLCSKISLWESSPPSSIENYDDNEDWESVHYLHKVRLLAMWLQSLEKVDKLTKDTFDFLIAPENAHLLENEFIFKMLRDHRIDLHPVILESLMLLENKIFFEDEFFWKNLKTLQSIIQNISSTRPVALKHVSELIKILLIPPENEIPHSVMIESYLQHNNIPVNNPNLLANQQHIDNINQIKNYLQSIDFYTATERDPQEIDEVFVNLEYSSLYTFIIKGKSLASQITIIPGEIFIKHNIWDQLLECCKKENPLVALQKCIQIAHQEAINEELSLDHQTSGFDVFAEILLNAIKAELEYKNKPNSMANSIYYQSPNLAEINKLLSSTKDNSIQDVVEWLKKEENVTELNKGMFGITFTKALKKEKPFECCDITQLTEYFKRLQTSNLKKKSPREIENIAPVVPL